MRLRRWQPADLTAVTDIASENDLDSALVQYMAKNISTHWDQYRHKQLRWLRDQLNQPGVVGVVVETEPGDTPTGDTIHPGIPQNHRQSRRPHPYPPGSVIAGAIWSRGGTSPSARKWQTPNKSSWRAWLERTLRAVEAKYYAHTPGMEPTWDAARFAQVLPFLTTGFEPSIFAEAWELAFLSTDPRWHRRGAGSLCIHWGLERAGEEKVPAVVAASPVGYGAYVKNGFVPLRRVVEFEEMFRVEEPGIWFLVWEPPGRKGNWLERAWEAERDKRVEKEGKGERGDGLGKVGEEGGGEDGR